jgi:hypothetical protein
VRGHPFAVEQACLCHDEGAGELKSAHSLDVGLRAGGDEFDLVLPLRRQKPIGRGEDVYDADQVKLADGGNYQEDNAQGRKIHAA